MKSLEEGAGIFVSPAMIREEAEWQSKAAAIGRVDDVLERYYAISIERRVRHPVSVTKSEFHKPKFL